MAPPNQEKKREKVIRRIDHSKIQEEQIIFMGGVYEKNGDYVGPLPYIEKTQEELEKEKLEFEERIKKPGIDTGEFSETEKETKRKEPLSVANILDLKFSEKSFLVEKIIPSESICVLSGYPESGKSWLLLELARAVASGSSFLGEYQAQKGNVLFIDEETGFHEFKRRIELLRFESTIPIYFFSQSGFKVDNREDLERLLKVVREKEIKLVIIDPFIAIHSKRENEAQEMQKVMEAFQEFILEKATVVFAHHHRKELGWGRTSPSQSLRGSSVLFGRVDSHLAVEKKRESIDETEIVITHEKLRRGKKINPFRVIMSEDKGQISLKHAGEFQKEKEKIEQAKEALRNELAKEDLTRKEALERVKDVAGRMNISKAFSQLKQDGEIEEVSKKEITRLDGKKRKISAYSLKKEVEIEKPSS